MNLYQYLHPEGDYYIYSNLISNTMAKIKQNNYVLFFYNDSKKWLVKISKNDQLHTHIGVIKHGDAIGKEYGSRLITNKDKYVYLLNQPFTTL